MGRTDQRPSARRTPCLEPTCWWKQETTPTMSHQWSGGRRSESNDRSLWSGRGQIGNGFACVGFGEACPGCNQGWTTTWTSGYHKYQGRPVGASSYHKCQGKPVARKSGYHKGQGRPVTGESGCSLTAIYRTATRGRTNQCWTNSSSSSAANPTSTTADGQTGRAASSTSTTTARKTKRPACSPYATTVGETRRTICEDGKKNRWHSSVTHLLVVKPLQSWFESLPLSRFQSLMDLAHGSCTTSNSKPQPPTTNRVMRKRP